MMSNIDFNKDCLLARHMKEVWQSNCGSKAIFAGALLCRLGYPYFAQLPDITSIAQLVQSIVQTKQLDLLSEATEKCRHCPHSGRYEVEPVFINV
jgi:hypothetical protein